MVTREEFAELVSAVQTLEIQVSALEANQRNAESSTTRCSAAGCGIEHSKPDRSAGREPLLSEYLTNMEKRIENHRAKLSEQTVLGSKLEILEVCLVEMRNFIEERRRSAGCTKPPAG